MQFPSANGTEDIRVYTYQKERSDFLPREMEGNKVTNGKRRFPRLLEGIQGAALARLFWTEPEKSIRIAKDGTSINFVFKVRIRKEVVDEPFQTYSSFFLASPAHLFEKALQEGYDRTVSGKKPVHRHISTFLRRACLNAFQTWLENSWEINGYQHRKEGELKTFKEQAKIQPGPQPNSADAVKVIRLYEKYFKLVRDARNKLKPVVPLTTGRALAIVQDADLLEKISNALRTILKNPKADLDALNANIGTAEVAEVITKLQMSEVDFRKISFRKYRASGKKLLRDEVWETREKRSGSEPGV
jgi:hypothetical protein